MLEPPDLSINGLCEPPPVLLPEDDVDDLTAFFEKCADSNFTSQNPDLLDGTLDSTVSIPLVHVFPTKVNTSTSAHPLDSVLTPDVGTGTSTVVVGGCS